MTCRFYGKNGMFGQLIDTAGNQCGLKIDAHSPCMMEVTLQIAPDELTCPYLRMVQAQAHLAESTLRVKLPTNLPIQYLKGGFIE